MRSTSSNSRQHDTETGPIYGHLLGPEIAPFGAMLTPFRGAILLMDSKYRDLAICQNTSP